MYCQFFLCIPVNMSESSHNILLQCITFNNIIHSNILIPSNYRMMECYFWKNEVGGLEGLFYILFILCISGNYNQSWRRQVELVFWRILWSMFAAPPAFVYPFPFCTVVKLYSHESLHAIFFWSAYTILTPTLDVSTFRSRSKK